MRWMLALALTLTACGGVDELVIDPSPVPPRAGEIRLCVADCGRDRPTAMCVLSISECPAEVPEWCTRVRVVWAAPHADPLCDVGA